ncbi:MAG: zinc ribbon domain-containing protein [Burkholderiales bacterium]|nr:zinc ribbon domain-containing protein [Burkholderiales bacterium]
MQLGMNRSTFGGVRAALVPRLLMAFLALTLLPAYAAGPSAAGAPLRSQRLESMQVEVWPEFDRPAALVILRGALAADTKLPADVTLRIAASTGGPSAMAYSAAPGGNLLNLEHERIDAKDFITLRFKVPERYFHVEFYDPLATGAPERSYTYVWPGDLGVNRLSVVVQEPAAASDFSVQPNLGATATGPDGLVYHSAELGAHEAGKPLPIKVSYKKTDARTTSEILQPKTPNPTPTPDTPAVTHAPSADASDEVTKGVLVFILAVSLLVCIGTGVLWWRGRASTTATRVSGAGACTQCGTPREADDRFCSKCGARLK